MEIKVEEFKTGLVSLVNESALPLSLVYYIMQDILNEVEAVRKKDLENERAALESSDKNDFNELMAQMEAGELPIEVEMAE